MAVTTRSAVLGLASVLALSAALLLEASAAAAAPSPASSVTLSVAPAGGRVPVGEPLRIELEVSYEGFNGAKDLVIDAVEGQQVELTFVWADPAVPDNAHRVYVKGYDLETGLLTPDHPAETLSFVADQVGDFELVCNWKCFGHADIVGRLTVTAGATGSGSRSQPPGLAVGTRLSVDVVSDGSGAPSLRAHLVDDDGAPVADAGVVFDIEAGLGDVTGFVELGRAETDAEGVATVSVGSRPLVGDEVRARFAGTDVYLASDAGVTVDRSLVASRYEPERTALRSLVPWGRAAFVGIVLGIWAILAHVVFQLVRIGPATAAAASTKEGP